MRIRTMITLHKTVTLTCLALASPLAASDDDNGQRLNVEVAFGRGLNTAVPLNPPNHAILPQQINVKKGGVVDFGIAGFHDILIFKPGVQLQDVIDAGGGTLPSFPPVYVFQPDPSQPFNNAALADKIYYRGLNPAGGPANTPVTPNPSNTSNRSEPVSFLEKGTYLVICNIRPHLVDGMYAYVKVSD
jgi:hypothetical protein